MAEALTADPVQFFVGVLAADTAAAVAAREALAATWGEIVCEREPRSWHYSDYYASQTGGAIQRAFYGFAALMDPGDLARRKLVANRLERELAANLASPWPRPVNLDPGYLAPDKLVLASCKNFAHRIYLGRGVYGEITLLFRRRRFTPLEWTFPDYAGGEYHPFFLALRARLCGKRRPL